MWILESSSELFQGRRMWLKPGKSYLFGRVKKDGVRFAIEHKTISRKHFIIRVDDVRSEDVGNINARTKVTIEDQNSKAGTSVNSIKVKSSSRELDQDENYIRPGSFPQDLVIRWNPCVLTFNLLKKEIKSGVLKSKQERVKDLDIKAVSDYLTGKSTYLVVNKRNTPKSLQALIDGKALVAESYLDALEYAATPSDLNEEENLSPLEQDFDSAWPDPKDYLPPPGREPTLRPAESYRPSNKRRNVFKHFTFVFLDQTQYDNLLPPITTGHGKALLFKLVAAETTTENLIKFLRDTAGLKGFGNERKGIAKGGVILVRYKGDAGVEDWTNALINEVSLKLDQRAIDQGEFLDVILANDGSLLRQAVPLETDHDGAVSAAPPPPVTANTNGHTSPAGSTPQASAPPQSSSNDNVSSSRRVSASSMTDQAVHQSPPAVHESESEPEPPIKRARFIVPKKSRLLDFDDDFNPDDIVPYEEEPEAAPQATQTNRQETPIQGDSDDEVAKEEPPSSRKRPRPASQDEQVNRDDDLDDLLPGAASMKRRKLATKDANTVKEELVAKPTPAFLRKSKQEKDIDVREIARAQRKAEQEKEEAEDMYDDVQLEPGETLPVYDVETVTIDLPERKRSSKEPQQTNGENWDPKWNGRKNFKGFRRARDSVNGEAGRRLQNKIIVPLVDAKTSTYGMGDQYWDRTAEEKERDREKKRKASQRATQSQNEPSGSSRQYRSQTVPDDSEEEESLHAKGVQTSPELLKLQDEAADIVDHVVDVDEPRRTRASDSQTQTQTTTLSAKGAKRPANGVGRGGAAKKQKTLPITTIHGSDSDDSDDMKFKFGSRRRGKGRA